MFLSYKGLSDYSEPDLVIQYSPCLCKFLVAVKLRNMEEVLKEATQISDLREDLRKQIKKQIFQVFPEKIVHLGKALQSEMFDTSNMSAIHCELMVPSPSPLANGSDHLPASEDDRNAAPKKKTLEEEVEGFPTIPPKRPAYFSGMVPGNVKLEAIIDFIKPEIMTQIDSCNSLKLWIQLLIPRIEDGNNFGVNIQVCLGKFAKGLA